MPYKPSFIVHTPVADQLSDGQYVLGTKKMIDIRIRGGIEAISSNGRRVVLDKAYPITIESPVGTPTTQAARRAELFALVKAAVAAWETACNPPPPPALPAGVDLTGVVADSRYDATAGTLTVLAPADTPPDPTTTP